MDLEWKGSLLFASPTASKGSPSSDISASVYVNRTSGIGILGSDGSEHQQDGNIRRMLADHDFAY